MVTRKLYRKIKIFMNYAQGSQVASNFPVEFRSLLTIFSSAISQEIFLLAIVKKMDGCFHALAMISFAPVNMNKMSLCRLLAAEGIG